MQLLPDNNEGKLLALGLLLIPLILLYMIIHYSLILPHLELNQEGDELGKAYHRFHATASQQKKLEDTISLWQEAQRNNHDTFLSQKNFNLAAASLQERLKERVWNYAISEKSCQIVSQQNVPSKEASRFIKVTVKVKLNCWLPALQTLFYELEAEKPILMLDNITIRRIKKNERKSKNKTKQPPLEVSFEMIGYVLYANRAG